jgi:hypothetical protein
MRIQRIGIALTCINLAILMFTLVSGHGHSAAADDVVPVLKARKLQIVDEQGRTRAEIIVAPPSTMPDGKKYAETTLFRLIDPNGRPGVKIATSADGSGLSVAGDSERRDWNGLQILADAKGTSLILTNKDGRVQTLKP